MIYGTKVEIWWSQPAAADGTVLPPVKDFREDSVTASTEAQLFQFTKASGVLDADLVRMINTQIASVKR
jgi:hypothetical protein